ncbi:MAG TPA: hypothetical protein VF433_15260 [Cellvibrio sp.]
MADKAASIACGLYRDYPNFATGGGIDPFNTYPRQASKQVWDSLCGSRGQLPPPPSLPFTGGQCVCVEYFVNYRQTHNVTGAIFESTSVCRGPIKGFGKRVVTSGNTFSYQYYLSGGNATCPQEVNFGTFSADIYTYTVLSVARTNGQPDNCGNPPSGYPNVDPPPNRTYGNDSITYNDGTNISIPFLYVPVDFSPTFSPNIRIDLGGFTFNFDLGGVDIYLPDKKDDPRALPPATGYPTAPPTGLPRPTPDPNRPNPNPPPGNKPPQADCPDCPEFPPQPTPPGEGDPPVEKPPEEGEEVIKPGIEFLEVVLTILPDKVHYGNEGANVVFAGWVAFRSKSGSYYPREQINFQRSVFRAPVGADGYTYTFTNGASGYVREY